jgi:two-component system alkaline phosphatase synthesis response regulator PhoP
MAENRMSKKKILIIDDDPDVRLSLRLPLESADYDISEATNSGEGLATIKKIKPDLVILDVMMDTGPEIGICRIPQDADHHAHGDTQHHSPAFYTG